MARLRDTLRSRFALLALLVGAGLLAAGLSGGRAGRAAPLFQGGEYVKTYAADCATPQTIFDLGDTVCAEVGAFPLSPTSRYRRFLWRAPNYAVADLSGVKVDPQFDKFVIPTSGALAQPGTWHVRSVDASAEGHASAKFIVRRPFSILADLWIRKTAPELVRPGERVIYRLELGNPGPDPAADVTLITEVPSDMAFLAVKQLSGPPAECSTPQGGGTGRIICKTKGLALDEGAEFAFYYEVSREAREGTVSTASSSVQSSAEEVNKDDNFWRTETLISEPRDGSDGGGGEEP